MGDHISFEIIRVGRMHWPAGLSSCNCCLSCSELYWFTDLFIPFSLLHCAMSCRGGAANSYRHPTKLHNKSASHRSPSESQPWTPRIIVLARRVVKDHVHRGVVGNSRRNWPRLCSSPHSQRELLFCASSARYGRTPEGVRKWAGPIRPRILLFSVYSESV
jgi:hypothetical protein